MLSLALLIFIFYMIVLYYDVTSGRLHNSFLSGGEFRYHHKVR